MQLRIGTKQQAIENEMGGVRFAREVLHSHGPSLKGMLKRKYLALCHIAAPVMVEQNLTRACLNLLQVELDTSNASVRSCLVLIRSRLDLITSQPMQLTQVDSFLIPCDSCGEVSRIAI